jgi:hypothetical protein
MRSVEYVGYPAQNLHSPSVGALRTRWLQYAQLDNIS